MSAFVVYVEDGAVGSAMLTMVTALESARLTEYRMTLLLAMSATPAASRARARDIYDRARSLGDSLTIILRRLETAAEWGEVLRD